MTNCDYQSELKGLEVEFNDLLRKALEGIEEIHVIIETSAQACIRLISSALLDNPTRRKVSGYDADVDDLIQETLIKLHERDYVEVVKKIESLYKLLIGKLIRRRDALEYRLLLITPLKAISDLPSVAKTLILRILTRQVNKHVLDYFSTHNLFPCRQVHFAQPALAMAALQ